MSNHSPGLVLYIFFVISVVMFIWGILGFLEYFSGVVLFTSLQNDAFPPGTQFLHWLLITLFGGTFLYGFLTKFKYTPSVIVAIAVAMSTLCFIETFDFMTTPNRYFYFVIECIAYIYVSLYLLRFPRSRKYFGYYIKH